MKIIIKGNIDKYSIVDYVHDFKQTFEEFNDWECARGSKLENVQIEDD